LQALYCGRVTDVYGSTEFKEIAVQCEHGRYHVNFESVYVESIPDAEAGHPRLLITSLLNRAMPLIRFDIGDHADVGSGRCRCGRAGPYITQAQGRSAEMLRFGNGAAVTPFVLTTIVGAYKEIRNYTIVHRAPEEICIRVFADPALADSRAQALIGDVAQNVPAGVRITVEPLAERMPAGKRTAVTRTF
jgi:phenylacetate-CoA ligase